jgi:hypothetical protein
LIGAASATATPRAEFAADSPQFSALSTALGTVEMSEFPTHRKGAFANVPE